MKLSIVMLLGLAASASAGPAAKDMGTWDCSGSKPQEVDVAPGDHDFVWRGSCSGEEGHSIVVDPANADLVTTQDDKHGLTLHAHNKAARVIRVKVHVFVGFA